MLGFCGNVPHSSWDSLLQSGLQKDGDLCRPCRSQPCWVHSGSCCQFSTFFVLVVLQGPVQLSGRTEPHGCRPWAVVGLEPLLLLLPQLWRWSCAAAAVLQQPQVRAGEMAVPRG